MAKERDKVRQKTKRIRCHRIKDLQSPLRRTIVMVEYFPVKFGDVRSGILKLIDPSNCSDPHTGGGSETPHSGLQVFCKHPTRASHTLFSMQTLVNRYCLRLAAIEIQSSTVPVP